MLKWGLLLLTLFNCFNTLKAQEPLPEYRIKLSDKNFSNFSLSSPSAFLSPKAILRREKNNIALNESDLPLSPAYVDSITSTGVKILTSSKWFNTVLIATNDSLALQKILAFPFVSGMETIKVKKNNERIFYDKIELVSDYSVDHLLTNHDYGLSFNQVNMVKGDYLHNLGFKGKGMTVAVMDGGFYRVDSLDAFKEIRDNNRILGAKDFVGNVNIYNESEHGMNVLSIMAANLKGSLIGTAPEANYWLFRTEDTYAEYVTEEDFWLEAAEFADSAGVNVIQSSLGYTTFDDSLQDHTYENMDGNTSIISKAAGMAASKGILVVVSAGNSGASSWNFISAPADNDSVLAIGSVDANSQYSYFSSNGPTYDGRIKPNVSAQGQATVLAGKNNTIKYASGTSFASPIISGLAASLWQAFPDKSNMEIFWAIEQSASQFENPDSLLGYGIPNFMKAFLLLSNAKLPETDEVLNLYPNPFANDFTVGFFSKKKQVITFRLLDFLGKSILEKEIDFNAGEYKSVTFDSFTNINSGIYFLRIQTESNSFVKKVVRF